MAPGEATAAGAFEDARLHERPCGARRLTVSVAVITGSTGLIGSEAALTSRPRHGRGRDRQRHAKGVLRLRGIDRLEPVPAGEGARRALHAPRWTSGTARGSTRSSAATDDRRARHPHRRATVTRLGGEAAAHRLRHQRGRHLERARGDAPVLARCGVHLHLHEQGLRRPPQLAPAPGARDPVGDRPRAHLRGRNSRGHVHRSLPAQPVRSVEGRRRRPGPGIRPLLRDADSLLSRRDPDRAAPLRRRAARLPCVRDALRDDRHPVHRVRIQGQAGARRDPQPRSDPRLPRVLPSPRVAEVYNIGGGRFSNASVLEAIG